MIRIKFAQLAWPFHNRAVLTVRMRQTSGPSQTYTPQQNIEVVRGIVLALRATP
jgi:hypothetical protein